MIIHQQTVEKIKHIIFEKSGESRLWIHIYGKEGIDTASVINTLLKHHADTIPLLFRLDASLFSIDKGAQLEKLIRRFFEVRRKQFDDFLHQFPRRIRQSLKHLSSSSPVSKDWGGKEPSPYLIHLFWMFVESIAREGRGFLVVENPGNEPNEVLNKFFRHLEAVSRATSLVILSTGTSPLTVHLKNTKLINHRLSRLSIREGESLVKSLLKTSAINARLITNHLHLKSRGNPLTIKFLLYAYFRPLLAEDPGKVMDGNILSRVKIPPDEQTIYQEVLRNIPPAGTGVFALLSRVSEPLPKTLVLKLLKATSLTQFVYREWLRYDLLQESELLGKAFVSINPRSWKAYVARQTRPKQFFGLIPVLGHFTSRRPPFLMTLELSPLFFEAGEIDLALRFAYREAIGFTREGEYHRALNRFAFLRRNLSRVKDAPFSEMDILLQMGDLQQKMGLFENAFEAFREYRDLLSRKERKKWLNISLRMAQLLFQMDAFSEVRYVIKEIKVKKGVNADIKANAAILQGDIEENSGKSEYAFRNYRTALEMLPKLRSQRVMWQLYTRLRSYYLDNAPSGVTFDKLANNFLSVLPENSPHYQTVWLDLIKYLLKHNNFKQALPITLSMYRRSGHPLQPETVLQLHLLLSEIYGFNGKWHLARGYIKRLLRDDVLIVNDDWRVKILLNAGIIEKELGYFGRALQFAEQALGISIERGDPAREHLCRIQLGHIYLMVHAMMKSREHLIAAYNWGMENHDEEVLFTSACFLSTYELYQQRPAKAAEYLQIAESTLSGDDNLIGYLNLTYYRINYLIQIEKLAEAEEIAREWLSRSTGIVKFEYVARWMLGKVLMHKGNTAEAEKILLEALKIVRRCRLSYPGFQILMDLASIARSAGAKQKAGRFSKQAQEAFGAFLTDVEDPILQRQIEESREFDVLLKSG